MIFLMGAILLTASASAAPGYPYLDDYHAPAIYPAPTIIKAAPILAPAPTIIKTAAPVYAAPVVKSYAPATSYATVTQVHVAHPQIVKVAQPIIKTVVAPQPILAHPSYDWPSPWAGGWH